MENEDYSAQSQSCHKSQWTKTSSISVSDLQQLTALMALRAHTKGNDELVGEQLTEVWSEWGARVDEVESCDLIKFGSLLQVPRSRAVIGQSKLPQVIRFNRSLYNDNVV